MTDFKLFIKTDEETYLPIDATPTTIMFDEASGKDESVVSIWDQRNKSFSFTSTLTKKSAAKSMWIIGVKTKLPRKLKKQWKKEK